MTPVLRFTIRDVLWLTVVVAVGCGWWMDHRQADAMRLEMEEVRSRAAWDRRVLHTLMDQLDQLKIGVSIAPRGTTTLSERANVEPDAKDPFANP